MERAAPTSLAAASASACWATAARSVPPMVASLLIASITAPRTAFMSASLPVVVTETEPLRVFTVVVDDVAEMPLALLSVTAAEVARVVPGAMAVRVS